MDRNLSIEKLGREIRIRVNREMITRHFFSVLVCVLLLSCPLVESPEDEAPPLTPSGLVVGNPTASSLFVSWQKSNGAENYQLFRDTSVNGNFSLLVYDGVLASYTDTNLKNDCTYHYKVRATNYLGSSPLSGSSSGKTDQAQVPPPVPSGLTVSNPTITSLLITWNSAQTATSYQLYRDTNATGLYSLLVYNGSNTNHTEDGLSSNTTFYYKIRATNAFGSSLLSSYASGTTLEAGSPPEIPTGLNTGSSTASSILVSWNPSLGAISYQVFRDTDSLGLFPLLVYNGSSTSFYDLNLSSGTEYFYKVRATNQHGSSQLSNYAVGGTTPTIPLGLSVGSPTASSLYVTWNETNGADSYQLYRDTDQNGYFFHLSYNGTVTEIVDTNLLSETTYYYKVKASNQYGSSNLSIFPESSTTLKPPLTAPTGVSASFGLGDRINIVWNPVPGASYYEIFIDRRPDGQFFELVGSTSNTSCDVYVATRDVMYFKVRAMDYPRAGPLSVAVPGARGGP